MNRILIIDDEETLRGLLARIIKLEGYDVKETGTLASAKKLLQTEEFEVVLCDVKLPDGNGVHFTHELRTAYPLMEVILLTAYGNIADGIQAMKNGAFDYITKGDDNDRVIPLMSRAIEKATLQKKVARLEDQVGKKYNFDSVIGKSKPIRQAIDLAQKVAVTDTTVLLLGETGSGKEVFAQAIHNRSSRSSKSFVALNCSAFSKELLESELFGHKAGSFTGATRDKKGLLEEAHTGTLFLDEIGDMPLELQSKLLRVLETSEFLKVGETRPTKVNVRFIAATNRQLQSDVNAGLFREDLFYRLNVFVVPLPALRERRGDIPLLVQYYLGLFATKTNKKVKHVSQPAMELMEAHNWKGNIRELKNIIERAVILADGNEVAITDLPYELQLRPSLATNELMLSEVERAHIRKVLHIAGGNKTEAARLLDIGLTTLYRKLEEYQLQK